jgi:hypothetical protein
MPSSRASEAWSVFLRAPSTYERPSIVTGGKRPGSAQLACTALEIATPSWPGRPKLTLWPVSRSVATR